MMPRGGAAFVDRVWFDDGRVACWIRRLLTPWSWVFGVIVAWRNRRFDRAWATPGNVTSPVMPLPAISIGNLTVGGTGKTPIAAWFAKELLERGGAPAIILRGYGDDEWRVHQLLAPAARVICDADRVRGARTARAQGADVVVLDDAFQHRRARRVADIVLLSADQWRLPVRVLPAGPYREGLRAVRRATCVIITVKAPGALASVDALIEQVGAAAPAVPCAVVRIIPDRLSRVGVAHDGAFHDGVVVEQTLQDARRGRWGVVSGIGDPSAFEQQLTAAGLLIHAARRYPDHHRYTPGDVDHLLGDFAGLDGVICTLKDAVKLGPLWPPGALPLWYVSQTLVVERGASVLVEQVDRVLSARTTTIPTSG